MTMKKKILTTLSVVLILGLAALGILAYLSDTDSDVNVMTLGNVQIEQIEQEWNENGTELKDFTQAKPLYPYVGEFGWKNTDNPAYRQFTMNNVVDKYVSVKNTGKSDAYVRTFIALEMGDYSYDEFNMVGVSINAENGSEFKFPGAWEWTDDFVAEIEGKNYNVMVAVHKEAVAPDETTIPSLLQVYLSKDATNETVEKLDGNGNGTYDILVYSEAVQTEGFADAKTALNTAFGDTSDPTRYHPWKDGIPGMPFVVKTTEELEQAIADERPLIKLGADVALTSKTLSSDMEIDLGGFTLDISGSARTLKEGADLVLKNGTVFNNATYGYFDIRPDENEESNLSFENVSFVNESKPSSGTSTNFVDSIIELYSLAPTAKINIVFEKCTFKNCQILMEGSSNGPTYYDVDIIDCVFNTIGQGANIQTAANCEGTIDVSNCTFNYKSTYRGSNIIKVSTFSNSKATITLTDNIVNGSPAVVGEDGVEKIDGSASSPPYPRFVPTYIGSYSTLTQTGTVLNGNAK